MSIYYAYDSICASLRATSRNYQLQVEIVKTLPPLKLRQNEALWALVTKSLV